MACQLSFSVDARTSLQSVGSNRAIPWARSCSHLLSSLCSQPSMIHNTRSAGGLQLVFSFLDDLCLAGEQAAVLQALATLTASAARIGLQLNGEKCEIIPTSERHTINQ